MSEDKKKIVFLPNSLDGVAALKPMKKSLEGVDKLKPAILSADSSKTDQSKTKTENKK